MIAEVGAGDLRGPPDLERVVGHNRRPEGDMPERKCGTAGDQHHPEKRAVLCNKYLFKPVKASGIAQQKGQHPGSEGGKNDLQQQPVGMKMTLSLLVKIGSGEDDPPPVLAPG